MFKRRILRPMLRGLVVVLPIVLTVYVTVILLQFMDGIFGRWLQPLLPEGWYFPGTGIAIGIIVILGVGFLADYWLVRGLVNWAEDLLEALPLVKSIYGSLRDLAGFFSSGDRQKRNQVVLVSLPGGTQLVGLLTRESLADLPLAPAGAEMVAVYIPFSYMLGGATILVPRSAIQPVNMTMEEAMRFAVTAGMSTTPPSRAVAAPAAAAAAPAAKAAAGESR